MMEYVRKKNTNCVNLARALRSFLITLPSIPIETDLTLHILIAKGARGGVVFKALCYKPEVRGFWTRCGEQSSLIYLILPAALGPGGFSASYKMSTRKRKMMFLGSRARPVHKADSFTAICEPIV
jgi:hypothetical protein